MIRRASCPSRVVVCAVAAVGVLGSALGAQRAHASTRVSLSFVEAPTSAEYSQGVALDLQLGSEGGDAVVDGTAACGGEPCRVVVTMRADDGTGSVVQVTEPDVVVDAAGRAHARLVLVDGRHGGATFVAAPEGFAYTLTARFSGAGTPLPDADDVDCAPGVTGTPDGRLCPTTTTTTLLVLPEVPALSFAQDLQMTIGDTVTLAATLSDPNGDATGDDVDGPAPKLLAGLPVRFAYDVNGNGRPDFQDGELLGEALTNDLGVAAFTFTADPTFVRAGQYDAALHAEFPGDDHYGVARTSTALVVNARGPDAKKTIVEVDPTTIAANGADTAAITVKLVDEDGNLLGPDSDPHDVAITADLGLLRDDVERSPLDGFYRQTLQAPRKAGTATIRVTVDGEDAGSVELVLAGDAGGCGCASSSSSSSPVDAAVVAALSVFVLRRRRREVSCG
jgi:MYXO-CTERM domain-containing protein